MILRHDGFVRGSTRDPWVPERDQFVNQTEEVANHESKDGCEGDDVRSRRGARTDVRQRVFQAQLIVGGRGVSGRRSSSTVAHLRVTLARFFLGSLERMLGA